MGNGCRARVSTGPTISITATRPINPHGVAKRILVLMPVAPIPNLAFEKPAGGTNFRNNSVRSVTKTGSPPAASRTVA